MGSFSDFSRKFAADTRLSWSALPRGVIGLGAIATGFLVAAVPISWAASSTKAVVAVATFVLTAVVSFASGRITRELDDRRSVARKTNQMLLVAYNALASLNHLRLWLPEAQGLRELGVNPELLVRRFMEYVEAVKLGFEEVPAFDDMLDQISDMQAANKIRGAWHLWRAFLSPIEKGGKPRDTLLPLLDAQKRKMEEAKKNPPVNVPTVLDGIAEPLLEGIVHFVEKLENQGLRPAASADVPETPQGTAISPSP